MITRFAFLVTLLLTFPLSARAEEGQAEPAPTGAAEPGQQIPPPASWKPAGEVEPPAPLAMVPAVEKTPSPMIQRGEFELDLHGRVQTLFGLVGEDANTQNGDVLSRDGFRLRRARLGLEGQLVRGWEYGLELDLVDEYSGGDHLLDAYVRYRPVEYAWVTVGAGKVPFSRTLLTSSGGLQFVERPLWVPIDDATDAQVLDPGRQVGISVGTQVSLFSCTVGVFNGSRGFSKGNLSDGLLYAVRLTAGMGELGASEADLTGGELRWSVGLNGYLNQAPAAEIRAAGADLAVKWAHLSFTAEAVWAKIVPDSRPEGPGTLVGASERWGLSAQAGYVLPFSFADVELAARFALFDDQVYLDDEGDLWELAAGVNAYLYDGRLKLMLDYLLKEERHGADLSNDAVVLMMQLGF